MRGDILMYICLYNPKTARVKAIRINFQVSVRYDEAWKHQYCLKSYKGEKVSESPRAHRKIRIPLRTIRQ